MNNDENGSRGGARVPDGMTATVLNINGEAYPIVYPTHHTLLEVLREECKLPGTKHGCELGSAALVPCWWMASRLCPACR